MREEVYWAGYKTIHEFESTEAIILGTILSTGPKYRWTPKPGPKSTGEHLSHRACAIISGEWPVESERALEKVLEGS